MKWCLIVIAAMCTGAATNARATSLPDTVGPVAPWRGHVLVSDEGVQADASPASPVPGAAWSPQWFTASKADRASTVYLLRTLDVRDHTALKHALFKVSGDRAYRVWINGVLVLRGPDDPGSDVGNPPRWTHQWLYNTVDAGPYLHPGENRIAVEVVNADVLSAYSTGRTGFAFSADLRYTDGGEQRVEGPGGWVGKATATYRVGSYAGGADPVELQFFAAEEPLGWPLPKDAADWAAAEPRSNSWGRLQASMIPARMEADWPATTLDAVVGSVTHGEAGDDITVNSDARFTLQFGRVISAYLALQAEAAHGAVVTLVPRETADQSDVARPIELNLRDGVTTWESPGYDSFSQVEVRVTHVTSPVKLHFVRAIFTSQPVRYRGSFESSDAHLDALWKAARWQTQICLQDRFLDSPNHQEPIGDPGDYLIAAGQSDYAFGDPWMAAQNLRQFGALLDKNSEVTFHASYPLFWVQMLLQYYDHTGDLSLVRELAPSVDRLLKHLGTYRGANGLLSEAPNYMFMDWIEVEGFNLHHPPAVIGQGYFSALYYRGLRDGERMARLLGDAHGAEAYAQRAAELRTAFENELWDEKAGLYRDGKPFQNHQPLSHYFPADRPIETHTDQVNLFASLYGLAPPERNRRIVERLLGRDRLDVQPYFMHFAFDAEAATGQWDKVAGRQLQRWQLNPQTKTFREMWNAGDWSHSWGGTPLIQLSSRVLGVTPAAPGYSKVRIAPQPLDLKWARGTVPTPHGMVHVDWKRDDSEVTVAIATEKSPVVLDPSGFGATFGVASVDGKLVTGVLGEDISLAAGSHAVVLRKGEGASAPVDRDRTKGSE